MSYTQLVSPNLSAVGRLGWCLEYASRFVFKNPAAGTTAWNAWLVCNQHRDQNFPSGVSFPVWFSGAGGAGHVAVFTPSGIYSSPYNVSNGHAVLSSIAEVERLYGVKYVGWSEDILYHQVIGGNMGIITTEAVVALSLGTQGTQPQSPNEYAQWVGKSDQQSWDDLITHYSAKGQARQAELESQISSTYVPVKEQLYKKG